MLCTPSTVWLTRIDTALFTQESNYGPMTVPECLLGPVYRPRLSMSSVAMSESEPVKTLKSILMKADSTTDHKQKKIVHFDIPTLFIDAARNGLYAEVEAMVNQGFRVNYSVKATMETALIVASKKGYVDVVELLIESGASVTMTDHQYLSALDYACQHFHLQVVELLMSALGPFDWALQCYLVKRQADWHDPRYPTLVSILEGNYQTNEISEETSDHSSDESESDSIDDWPDDTESYCSVDIVFTLNT